MVSYTTAANKGPHSAPTDRRVATTPKAVPLLLCSAKDSDANVWVDVNRRVASTNSKTKTARKDTKDRVNDERTSIGMTARQAD